MSPRKRETCEERVASRCAAREAACSRVYITELMIVAPTITTAMTASAANVPRLRRTSLPRR
jgi:hypothetical protein